MRLYFVTVCFDPPLHYEIERQMFSAEKTSSVTVLLSPQISMHLYCRTQCSQVPKVHRNKPVAAEAENEKEEKRESIDAL